MSQVHEALQSQRQVWRQVCQTMIKSRMGQSLPSTLPHRILLFGVGSSFFAAKLTAYTLSREMLTAKKRPILPVIACSSVGIGIEVIPKKGDWVFAFSHRGRSEATLAAMDQCSRAGAFTAWVTAQGAAGSPSAQLTIPTSELEKCEPHTVGMTSAVCAVTTLLVGSAAETWMSLSAQKDPDLAFLREKLVHPPTLILGEWEGEWIAREIALKLTEMTSIRPLVYGSEEYFHGPKILSENVGSTEKIWYIFSGGDQRSHQITSEYRVDISGASSLSWVSALVELQWSVLALALHLGKNSDAL